MKVLVSGSRGPIRKETGPLLDLLLPALSQASLVIHGGATGVDEYAEWAAKQLGIDTLVFKPDYAEFGQRAPLVRNSDMVALADAVICVFLGRITNGTAYTAKAARKANKLRWMYTL